MEMVERKYYTPLVRQTIYYLLYHGAVAILLLLLISVIAFIHFLLKHRLAVIDEWVFDRGWEIMSLCKLLGAYVLVKFINLGMNTRNPLRDVITKGWYFPRREILVIILFLFIFAIFLGRPTSSLQISVDFFKTLVSFLGIFILYATDLFIIRALDYRFPLNKYSRRIRLVLFPLCFFAFTKIFQNAKFINYFIIYNFLLLLYLVEWKQRKSWSLPVALLVGFICPIGAFFGLDPLWGSEFSFWRLASEIGWQEYFALCAVSMGSIYYKTKPE